jgi:hypothetical protein
LVLVSAFCSTAHAQQLQLLLHAPPAGGLVATDVWNAEVVVQGAPVRGYFEGMITNDQGRVVCEVRSVPVNMPPGITRFSNANVPLRKVDHRDAKVEAAVLATGNFPPGTYTLCTRILSADRDQELVRTCLQVNVAPGVMHPDDARRRRKVDVYGSASVTQVMTDPAPVDRELPASFTRLQADPGISLLGVPVAGQFRYTTEATDARSEVNMFALRFDRPRFEQNLRHLVLRKLAEARLESLMRDQRVLEELDEAEKLRAVLEDPSLAGIDAELARVAEDMRACEGAAATDSARTCEEVRRRYQALVARKNQVDRLRERFTKLQAMRSSLEASGRLAEIRAMRSGVLPDIDDPRVLAAELERFGLFKGMNRALYSVEELTIGTAFPVYTPLTLNGNQVNGAHVAWNPGPVILTFTQGRIQRAYQADSLNASRFDQRMLGVRFGVGRIHGNHVIGSFLRFEDDGGSLATSSGEGFHPRAARLAGVEVQLAPGRERVFELLGEVNGLVFDHDRDQTTPAFASDLADAGGVLGVQPTLATSVDYAYRARAITRLFKGATVLSGGTQFVGPGYVHPGAFGLRNDLFAWDARLEQALLGNTMRAALSYATEEDNISDAKGITTASNTLGAEWSLSATKLPALRLRFTRNETRNTLTYLRSDVLNANASKAYRLGAGSASTMVNVVYYGTRTDAATGGMTSYAANAQQLFAFRGGLSVTVGGQYTGTSQEAGATLLGASGVNAQVARVFWRKLRVGLGGDLAMVEGNERFGLTGDVNGTIAKGLTVAITYNTATLEGYPGVVGSYQRQYLQARLGYMW